MTDLMIRMLQNSDPYISSVRKLSAKSKAEFSAVAIALLVIGQLPIDENDVIGEQNNIIDDVDSYFLDHFKMYPSSFLIRGYS